MTREVNDAGLALVRGFEGLRTDAYRCPAGVWTIGYGHTGDVRPGQHITSDDAERILREDLAGCGEQVEELISVALTDCQFAALVSFVFNAGAGALRGSTLRRRLNTGDYDCVPTELAKWVKALDPRTGQRVPLPGLVRRRAAEGELWLSDATDDPFRASPDMPQRVVADDTRPLCRVSARDGLRLRSGPGLEHAVTRLLPFGTRLYIERAVDTWVAADLEGDGAVDGYVFRDFLEPVPDGTA